MRGKAGGVNPNVSGYLNESISRSLKHTFGERWGTGVRCLQSNRNDSLYDPFGLPTDLNTLYSKVGAL